VKGSCRLAKCRFINNHKATLTTKKRQKKNIDIYYSRALANQTIRYNRIVDVGIFEWINLMSVSFEFLEQDLVIEKGLELRLYICFQFKKLFF